MPILTPKSWNRAELEAIGFEGFMPLVGLRSADVSKETGIYVVIRKDPAAPHVIHARNIFTGRKNDYAVEELAAGWHADTPVVYIGKAAGVRGLRGRLAPFGRKAIAHSGGRAIWQLEEADSLLVAWIATGDEDPDDVETAWIAEFKRTHGGRRPFANRSK